MKDNKNIKQLKFYDVLFYKVQKHRLKPGNRTGHSKLPVTQSGTIYLFVFATLLLRLSSALS